MQLFQHQSEALLNTEGLNRVAFYHDMGLGKTYTGSEKMNQLDAKVNLVVCQKSKVDDWVDHFVDHYELAENMMVYDLTEWKKGDWKAFSGDPRFDRDWHKAKKYVLVINYELAWRRDELLKLRDFTLMLDESSLIQNKTAKQTKFILKLRPANVILLSGTPTAGKYENLWTQAHLLGWDISDALYQKQYVNWVNMEIGAYGQRRIIRVVDKKNPYRNVDRLKEKLREHGAHFLKTEEVMSLPDQTFSEIKVPKTKEYVAFMKKSIVTVRDLELVGDTNLVKRLRSRQLCGQYNEAKIQAFRDLVSSTNDRLIVFYNFTEELKCLEAVCEKLNRPVSQVNGIVKDLAAYESEDNSVTIVQYQAGSMGLNLQKANKIVYFTLPERCELWMQSQKRIHRIGQEHPCFYYIMMARGSVEEKIYAALKRGVDFTDELFREVE